MRYIYHQIMQDIENKMVFITGPRQSGKTTLANQILTQNFKGNGSYLNWDLHDHRKSILKLSWNPTQKLIILDEIHKYSRWKNWLKGVFDVYKSAHSFLVTGSARLDIYRRGGDSMLGRYHLWRLHPFSLDEHSTELSQKETYDRLMSCGGFPEPFLKGDIRFAKRWRRDRIDKIIKEDIRDLESIKDLTMMSLFVDALRSRVGKPIALANLAQDLEISPKTAKKWLEILEKMYVGFTVYPLIHKKISRSLSKQPKFYFYDNMDVDAGEGERFENLVATHLLKRMHFYEDFEGDRCELKYIRDKEKNEVDFVLIRNKKVEELIEVKLGDIGISKSLIKFSNKMTPEKSTQIVGHLERPFIHQGVEVVDVKDYFKFAPWNQNK